MQGLAGKIGMLPAFRPRAARHTPTVKQQGCPRTRLVLTQKFRNRLAHRGMLLKEIGMSARNDTGNETGE
jgi:hypothetical protein